MTKAARARPDVAAHAADRATPAARARAAAAAPPAPAAADELGDAALDAAAELFRRQGYSGTSLRAVADAAHLHPGSLHYRWPTKEALLAALVERAITRVTAAVTEAMAGSGDLAERLRLGVRAHLSMLLSGDASFHVLLYDWRSLEGAASRELLRQRARYEAFWDGLLRAAIDAGLARDGIDPVLVRQFGFGAMNWVAQWYQPGHGPAPIEIADAFWDYLAFGLLAEPGRRRLAKRKPAAQDGRAGSSGGRAGAGRAGAHGGRR